MKEVREEAGWALLEVAASLLLLSILLVAILQSWISVAGRVAGVQDLLSGSAAESVVAADASSWSWGALAGDTCWLDGPVLEAVPRTAGLDGEIRLGVWLDGWFQGEYPLDEETVVVGDPWLWQAHAGADVVLRARSASGGWGPPRRLVVPGGAAGAGDSAVSYIMVHAPAYVLVKAVAQTGLGEVQAAGGGSIPLEVVGDLIEVTAGGSAQAFRAQGGRDIDLFF